MTELDTKLRAAAEKLINDLGKDITFIIVTGGGYLPGQGKYTGRVKTPVVVKCSPPIRFTGEYKKGDLIIEADLQLILSEVILSKLAVPFVPEEGTTVTFDSTTAVIVAVEPLYSGDLIAAYDIGLDVK